MPSSERDREADMKKENSEQTTDNIILSILSSILKKNDIQPYLYSIGNYQEEAVCLERKENGWIVYDGERGQQNHLDSFSDLYDACCSFITRLSESNDMKQQMIVAFQEDTAQDEPTVTEKDLVKILSERAKMSPAQVNVILSILPKVIGEELHAGKKVQLAGLGTFDMSNVSVQIGRDTQIDETIQIPATRSSIFKAENTLIETIKGHQTTS